MKKEKNSSVAEQEEMKAPDEKVQYLKGFLVDDYKIIKRTTPDRTVYEHPNQALRELMTYDEDLFVTIDRMFNNFQLIVDYLNKSDDVNDHLPDVLAGMIRDSRFKLSEIFYFIEKCIGNIECTFLDGQNTVYRDGRMLDACLDPPQEDTEELVTYDHDPGAGRGGQSSPGEIYEAGREDPRGRSGMMNDENRR